MLTADDVQKWLEEVRARPDGAQGAPPEPGKDRARGAAPTGPEGSSLPNGRGAAVLVLRDPVRVPRPEGVLAAMSAVQPEPQPERQRSWALSLAAGLLGGLVLGVGLVGLAGSAPPWLMSALGVEGSPVPGDGVDATARAPAAEPAPAGPATPVELAPTEPVRLEPRPAEPEPAAAPAAPEPALAGLAASDVAPAAPRLVDPPRSDPRAVLVQADRRPLRRRSAPLDAPEPEDGPAVLTASAPVAGETWRPTPLPAPEPGAPIRLEVSASPAPVRVASVQALAAPPAPDRLPPPEVGDTAVATAPAPASPRARVALHLSPVLSQTAIYDAQAAVTEAGLDLTGTSIVRFGVAESEVRFFHEGDAAQAARIAQRVGARPRDFSAYRPAPPPGTLEVWLAQEG